MLPRVILDGGHHGNHQVWERDEGRCAWTSPEGKQCGSRWQVEIDHEEAAARGGPGTLDNLRLVCRGHNSLHAEETFGAEHMKKYRKGENATSSVSSDSSRSPPVAREALRLPPRCRER